MERFANTKSASLNVGTASSLLPPQTGLFSVPAVTIATVSKKTGITSSICSTTNASAEVYFSQK